MSPALTALNGFLLALNWTGEPGMTYTVQLSPDLVHWESLPYVLTGDGGELSLTVAAAPPLAFSRLRASAEGDTNGNGLPDLWEWLHFGRLDVDPQADPDGDGLSNYAEWLAGTDPLDAFNGERPVIRMASGREWRVPAGGQSLNAVALTLLRASGEPWPDAPVRLRMESGGESLLQAGDEPEAAVHEVIAYTDALGRIQPDPHAIHYLATLPAGADDRLLIEAGAASAAIRVRVLPEGASLAPPRELRRHSPGAEDEAFSWRGDPSGAEEFLIEELSVAGDWIQIVRLSASALPSPDPATGSYRVTVAPPH
jgi:hypothetical protein